MDIKNLKEQIKIAKKRKFTKQDAIDYLISDLSLTEQEEILSSKETEMDEEYQENQEYHLIMAYSQLLQQLVHLVGYGKY